MTAPRAPAPDRAAAAGESAAGLPSPRHCGVGLAAGGAACCPSAGADGLPGRPWPPAGLTPLPQAPLAPIPDSPPKADPPPAVARPSSTVRLSAPSLPEPLRMRSLSRRVSWASCSCRRAACSATAWCFFKSDAFCARSASLASAAAWLSDSNRALLIRSSSDRERTLCCSLWLASRSSRFSPTCKRRRKGHTPRRALLAGAQGQRRSAEPNRVHAPSACLSPIVPPSGPRRWRGPRPLRSEGTAV